MPDPPSVEPPEDGETYALGPQPSRPNPEASETPILSPVARYVRRFFVEHWEHESETSMFLLVSMLDFFCTYLLLTTGAAGGVSFVESNPVAAWFLNHYGVVKGLLGFKLACVLLICVLSQIVSFRKPAYGRFILYFGTVLTAGVVVYSVGLLLRSYAG